MANSAQAHFRSISLPSRLNPKNFESELQKLKSFSFSKAPITSQNIQSGLLGLAELYNSVEELMNQSPSTQKSLIFQEMEESLEGSIQLIDSCSIIREIFQNVKENVQALQSALRRKGLDSSIQTDISTYLFFRKKMNKCVAKSLKSLKNFENRKNIISVNTEGNFVNIVLREVIGVSIAILKGILVFLCGAMAEKGKWSLVSKLVMAKSMAGGKEQSVVNEMDGVDLAIICLQGRTRSNGAAILDLQLAQRSLQNLGDRIEGLESGIEGLFRQLLRCRVAFLNILTDH